MNLKRLGAVAFGHFSIDVLNSSIAVILTVLSGKFDLSVSQIGLAAMIYTFAASLTQPFFGILADYLRGRWLGAIGVAWTAIFYALAAFAPDYPTLVACLTVGALGSGAFHPVGMINAAAAGGAYPTTATSFFFLLGQSGLALGPMAAGLVLQNAPIQVGLPLLALSALPAIMLMALFLRQPSSNKDAPPTPKLTSPPVQMAAKGETNVITRQPRAAFVITAFILFVALRSATAQSLTTLLPKYLSDLGYSPATYGFMIGIFAFGGAIGTFIGGYLGDRWNRRLILFISTLLSIPFTYALLHVEGWLFYLMAALAGGLLNIPHSILIIMAQRLLPAREGMMGGAVLGFMFASGATMAWLASWLADWFSLGLVLTALAFTPIIAAFSALLLPATRAVVTAVHATIAPAAAD